MRITYESLELATMDIKHWKRKYIAKQLKKNPNITIEELNKKIPNAKRAYFKDKHSEFDDALVQDINDIHKEGDKRGN